MTNWLTDVEKVFSNTWIFLLQKCEWCKSNSHFFSAKNINVFALFQDRNFNVTLARNFVQFWTTGPWLFKSYQPDLLLISKLIRVYSGDTCHKVCFYLENNVLFHVLIKMAQKFSFDQISQNKSEHTQKKHTHKCNSSTGLCLWA